MSTDDEVVVIDLSTQVDWRYEPIPLDGRIFKLFPWSLVFIEIILLITGQVLTFLK